MGLTLIKFCYLHACDLLPGIVCEDIGVCSHIQGHNMHTQHRTAMAIMCGLSPAIAGKTVLSECLDPEAGIKAKIT